VEEEIFYPAVKNAIEASELVDEAEKEHREAKSLISQLEKTSGQAYGEADFNAKFAELMQAIRHHVEEEEGEMFPQVEDSGLDLSALGARMMKRKQEISKSVGSNKTKSGTRSKSPSKTKSSRKSKSRSKTGRGSIRKRARAR
ncbi:MAG: hemerythrin domain-containing protein, partial [Candidatus Binatota bacterium]|nr:hemerythrin domain-containing protein [Candidatus Binatota bacterium]